MLLGFLFELKDINLHKNSPHKLVIPAEKTKLGIPPAPIKPCGLLKYVVYLLRIRNYLNKFLDLELFFPLAPFFRV